MAPFLATTQSPSTIGLASVATNLSPDLAVFVVIVDVVQTAIDLPAAKVTTCGVGVGGGGGAGLLNDGEEELFDPEDDAPGFDDPPPVFEAIVLPPCPDVWPVAESVGEALVIAVSGVGLAAAN